MKTSSFLLLALCWGAASAFTDTEHWMGAEYTPAAAPGNGYWWQWYDDYEPSVIRELPMLKKHMGLTTMRVWLMYGVYAADKERLLTNINKFLTLAAKSNITVGFVFFGDCFNHVGGSTTKQCTPKNGYHNGCWMASPQDAERVGVNASNQFAKLKPYVTDIVTKFKEDPRVVWWEIYNEPNNNPSNHNQSSWALGLRNAGYSWAKALSPAAPVMSCWDDSNNTDIVDHHDYGTAFKSKWAQMLYSNVEKGAMVTEGGSRWYQPDPGPATAVGSNQVDQGSPLTVLNFYSALRAEKKAGKRPYVPGGMICWELMVGNSNTRWHWNTALGSPEPAIPWDAWMFPDGTPISYTEVAAFRKYVSGVNDFIRYEDYLPTAVEFDGDVTLPLAAGSTERIGNTAAANEMGGAVAPPPPPVPIPDSALYEATVWASFPGDGNMTMVIHGHPKSSLLATATASAEATIPPPPPPLPPPPPQQQTAATAAATRDTCFQNPANVFNGIDIGGAGYNGINYRTLDVSKDTDPFDACMAACCAWNGCNAWVVQSGTAPSKNDHNCTASTTTCCWLKPNGDGARTLNPKSTAGVVSVFPPPAPAPLGPPTPHNVSGYHVVIVGATKTLQVERHHPSDGSITVMTPTFDLSTLENGLVVEAWNILRVTTAVTIGGKLTISVWFNPMFKETGFVGNSSDAARTPRQLPPRMTVVDPSYLPAGEMYMAAGGRGSQVDYASVLPIKAL